MGVIKLKMALRIIAVLEVVNIKMSQIKYKVGGLDSDTWKCLCWWGRREAGHMFKHTRKCANASNLKRDRDRFFSRHV